MTRRTVLSGVSALAPVAALAGVTEGASAYWPAERERRSVAPAAAGLDPAALSAAVAAAMADNSVGVIVLRGGEIAAEAYATDWGPAKSLELASAAKSVLSVLVGIAIDQGHIKGLDQSVSDFIPAWRGTPKQAITIRHMLSMTSGLGFEGLKVRNIEGDQFAINAAAPLEHPPGTHWAYNTPAFHLLYHVVERAVGASIEAFAQRVLLGPLGVEHWTWLTNVGHGPDGPVTNYYSALCSTRDLARFGLFALRGGRWEGRQLVDAGYFRASVSPSQDLNPSYGYLWWENARPGTDATGSRSGYRFEGAPRDTFAALGFGGQIAVEIPSLNLVVVRQGRAPAEPATLERLVAGIVKAARPASA
ncbi:MAG TPA: serine hydrolase [Caulobacteraceae bacterium]